MGRSPIRSRIVNAVPMNTAPTLSITRIWSGWAGLLPSGSLMPYPLLPRTVSVRMPMRNGSSAKNTV
ncbi:Uncharacterised protein [Mycobacterium tuberculosis]|nr:Uncharacterised protein [Mycobacterium tuberculosis]